MDLLVIPFIETTIPINLMENENGVACHVLMTKGIVSKNCRWSIEIMSINGIWYGTSSVLTNMSGYSGPCTRNWTTPFSNAEDCIEYYYRKVCAFLKSEGKGIPKSVKFEDFEESYPYGI